MDPVSVYRVGAAGARASHRFGGDDGGSELVCAAWLGWLPLEAVEWAWPDVALAGDAWLTAPPGQSASGRVVPGDAVTADDAARELLARRRCGLDAFTWRSPDVPDDVRARASSFAASVGDDLAGAVGRVRAAHEAWVEALAAADRESEAADGSLSGPIGDSPATRRCARAVRDLQERHRMLHALLDAVVRIGVFDPVSAVRRQEVADASSTP